MKIIHMTNKRRCSALGGGEREVVWPEKINLPGLPESIALPIKQSLTPKKY
jgi:hypothetical protein